MSHYYEHKGGSETFSFFSFLKMHYFNGKPHDGTDMELPFKTNASARLIAMNFSIPIPHPVQAPSLPVMQMRNEKYKMFTLIIPSGNSNTIFQPPKLSPVL